MNHYVVAIALAATLFPAVVLLARRSFGNRGLWISTSIVCALFLLLGYADWKSLPSKETPLIVYVMLALIPPILAALVIAWLAARRVAVLWQWLAAASALLISVFPTMVFSYYLLSAILPDWLGCCPL